MSGFDPAQLALESETLARHALAYNENVSVVNSKEMSSRLGPQHSLIRSSLAPVSAEFAKWKKEIAEKGMGHHATAMPLVEDMSPDVFSLISLRVLFDVVSHCPPLTRVALKMGRALEHELLLAAFEAQHPKLFVTVNNRVQDSIFKERDGYIEQSLVKAANDVGTEFPRWNQREKLIAGLLAVDLIAQATGFIEITMIQNRRTHRVTVVSPTGDLLKYIEEAHRRFSVLLPVVQPMVAPPMDHTGPYKTGGFYLPPNRRDFVKSHDDRSAQWNKPEDCPLVYRSVNAMQQVPLVVNRDVLTILEQTWDKFGTIPGMARRDDIRPEPEPVAPKESEEWKNWRAASKDVPYENRRNKGRRTGVIQTMALARKFTRYPRMWYPYQIDFRSRAYAVPAFLQPQGTDMAKGLLQFANKKPVTDRGLWWLKVHVANCFGVDKVSFEDRVRWVDDHRRDIEATAGDPIGFPWWHEADAPVQFLAGCLELVKVWEHGVGYESGAWIALDGSCNGLQHLAALTRDAQVGRLVNLCPSDKPTSIYSDVAGSTMTILSTWPATKAKVSTRDKREMVVATWAPEWHQWGFDRAGAKRPTMIVPYNGTKDAFKRYLSQWVNDREKEGNKCPIPPRQRIWALETLASAVSQAIDQMIPGPRAVMQASRECVSVITKDGKTGTVVWWRTPVGFKVVVSYRQSDYKYITTRVGDRVRHIHYYESQDDINRRKMAQSTMPHYVHSMDGAHMHLTNLALIEQGITDSVYNHDSYGVHLCHGDTLHRTTIDEFVKLYTPDRLQELWDQWQGQTENRLPPVPPRGTLDITEVSKSRYLFA